jgi:hypothetical protein
LSASFLTTLKLASVAAARASASGPDLGLTDDRADGSALRQSPMLAPSYVKLGLYPHSAQEDCVRA